MIQDFLYPGFGQCLQPVHRQSQAQGTARHLGQRFLAGDVERGQGQRHLRHRLQQQRRLADTRIAAHQHHRTFDQTAAQHAVEFAYACRDAGFFAAAHVLERGDLRRFQFAGPAAAPRRARRGAGRLQHDFRQGIPRPAFGALALPFVVLGAAFAADVGGLALGHDVFVRRTSAQDRRVSSRRARLALAPPAGRAPFPQAIRKAAPATTSGSCCCVGA